jgi:hypothetical protein
MVWSGRDSVMNFSMCTRASSTSTVELLYSIVRMPNMYALHHVHCPLPGVCVGAPPLSNPIHKTPPTIKCRHQVKLQWWGKLKIGSLPIQGVTKRRRCQSQRMLEASPWTYCSFVTSTTTPGTPPCSVPFSLPSSRCGRQCTWTNNHSALPFVLIEILVVKWCRRPCITYER